MKGGGLRACGREIKAKLMTAWRDGLVYWSCAHLVVFSIPVWWLQPLADNVATLFFNAYLSVLANKEIDEDEVEVEGAGAGAGKEEEGGSTPGAGALAPALG